MSESQNPTPPDVTDRARKVIAEAETYLYRYGINTDTTIDPIDLVRDLVGVAKLCLPAPAKRKPKARTKSCRC